MRLTLKTIFPFSCGDIVREKGGRHHARVEAVHSNTVKVRWLITRWVSYFEAVQIEKVPVEELA